MLQEDIDLSFLDEDTSAIISFVDNMFKLNGIYMRNDEPDVRDVEASSPEEMDRIIQTMFPNPHDTIQMVVPNGHDSHYMCGYFRLVLSGYGHRSPVNYKFETFMRSAQITSVFPRCTAAFVIGLEPVGNVPISVPTVFRLTSIEQLQFMGDLDMTCMQSIAGQDTSEKLEALVGGLPMPSCLPEELHWHIFKYLRHPCAELIKRESDRMVTFWDLHFMLMQEPFMEDWWSDSDTSDATFGGYDTSSTDTTDNELEIADDL